MDGAGITPGHAGPVFHPRGVAEDQLTQGRDGGPADARSGSALAGGKGARPGLIGREFDGDELVQTSRNVRQGAPRPVSRAAAQVTNSYVSANKQERETGGLLPVDRAAYTVITSSYS
jgi:hypothetical protein